MFRRAALLAAFVAVAACSGGPDPLVVADLTESGGCGMISVHAANEEWSRVIGIGVTRDALRARGAETDTRIEVPFGDVGLSVTLWEGRNLRNLFCNDFFEGNERVDARIGAVSGSVIVELERPIEPEFTCCEEFQTATVTITDLEFPGYDSVDELSVSAGVGWYPG